MPRKRPATAEYTQPCNPTDGDLMTVAKFEACCDEGGFIDYDGFGYPVRNNQVASIRIWPSERHRTLPQDATHVLWFNR